MSLQGFLAWTVFHDRQQSSFSLQLRKKKKSVVKGKDIRTQGDGEEAVDVFLTSFSGAFLFLGLGWERNRCLLHEVFLAFTLKWAVLLVLFVLIWDLSPSLLYLRQLGILSGSDFRNVLRRIFTLKWSLSVVTLFTTILLKCVSSSIEIRRCHWQPSYKHEPCSL